MHYSYTDKTLTIYIDKDKQAELREMQNDDPEYFQTDNAMWDVFEPLICNSELDWLNPDDTGDLTDAPMLGILDYETTVNEKIGPFGAVDLGFGEFAPITHRWAYMAYESKSPLQDLLETGKAVFVS